MVLGAEGVQIGTRFALTYESSASDVFKEYCLRLKDVYKRQDMYYISVRKLIYPGKISPVSLRGTVQVS